MGGRKGWQPGHIELADRADLLLVAPATAHVAQFAHGLAPDLLTSLHLATPAPVLLAPAMNGKMLDHPATQANLETLRSRDIALWSQTTDCWPVAMKGGESQRRCYCGGRL